MQAFIEGKLSREDSHEEDGYLEDKNGARETEQPC